MKIHTRILYKFSLIIVDCPVTHTHHTAVAVLQYTIIVNGREMNSVKSWRLSGRCTSISTDHT